MDEAGRLLTLLALASGAFTLLGLACAWFLDERRRLRRTLSEGLGAPLQLELIARGRGAGIALDLKQELLAVSWDKGAWRLTYRFAEIAGVELIVDRQVAARIFRGEARRGLEQLVDPQERVRLRFVFDDAAYPDFTLDLWRSEDAGRPGRLASDVALQEANRWMARMEAVLRRPAAARPRATPRPAPREIGPLFDDEAEDEPPSAVFRP